MSDAPQVIVEPDGSMKFVPAALCLEMLSRPFQIRELAAAGDKLTWTREGVIVEKQKAG